MTVAPRDDWLIERRVDTVRTLHEQWPEPGGGRCKIVALCSVVGPPAIVLGSTQPFDAVDGARAAHEGVEVVRRSSGGGAVLVGPAAQVWMDVWIPRDDALWDADVIRSSWWLGETWARALEGLGAPALVVHRGRAARTEWSSVVCFAGLAPGEVTVRAAKVVGLAQRRTRQGARLHSMALLTWDPTPLLELLSPVADPMGRIGGAALADVATGIRMTVPPLHDAPAHLVVARVEDALVSALP